MEKDIDVLIYNFNEKLKENTDNDSFWISRCLYFINSYLSSLSSFSKNIKLYDFLTNYDYSLNSVYKLYCETDSENLYDYMITLPAMTNEISKKNLSLTFDKKCYENHGYICMQLTNIIFEFDNNFKSIESQIVYNIFKKNKSLTTLHDFCNNWDIDWNNLTQKELEFVSLNFLNS